MTIDKDQAIEAEIQAKGLTAPRVTLAALNANIIHTEIVKHVSHSGQVLRWAVLTVRNGFAVTGNPSASVSAENDNAEIGEKVAVDNARNDLWALMGYALRERLANGAACCGHASDCAKHNEPAAPAGPCDCAKG